MLEVMITFLIVGSLGGLLVGLVGAGVGMVTVPILSFVFPKLGIPGHLCMHMALGTSMAVITVTMGSALIRHHMNGFIVWHLLTRLGPGAAIGGLMGSLIAGHIPSEYLRMIFGLFLLLIGLKMLFEFRPRAQRDFPSSPVLVSSMAGISTLASILGISGGAFIVPFLNRYKLTMHYNVATSSACSFLIGIFGMFGYIIGGLNASDLPAWSTGYVYWPAFLGITITSIIFAQIGAYIAKKAHSRKLQIFFGVVVIAVGLKMLLG